MITPNKLVKTLKEKELTMALAESMTCGMAAQKLSSYKMLSDVFKGSIVCYTPELKSAVLGISKKLMNKYTCESKEVTLAMAKNLYKLIPCDISAAITGLASGGGTETKGKPVGTVFFCVKYRSKFFNEKRLFRGTPLEIRRKACLAMYEIILSKL